jgi:ABC-2 type transport system permease protein
MNAILTLLRHELRLLCRSRLACCSLLLLALLASCAVWSGLREVARQQHTIARLAPLHEQNVAALSADLARKGDAGAAAYYTSHFTWDAPAATAFMALGQRDVAPFVLRVRALGLQAQLYEGEAFNPELALPGRFDFAFVLIYLAPLFVIALLHDLLSGEREAGRLPLLQAMPGRLLSLWWRRALLRFAVLLLCLAVPLAAGAALSGSALAPSLLALLTCALYLAFWTGLAVAVAVAGWARTSVSNATVLMGSWVLLTLLLPAIANLVLARAVPVGQGVELMMAQRQQVHGAWELPREDTMARFYASYPQWRDSGPLPEGFHWKWYFAFHQLGDDSVLPQARAYRAGLLARQQWTARLGWLLPGVGAQGVLHRLAHSDLEAQLAYQDRIAAFHETVRNFYYPYIFGDRPLSAADAARTPRFVPASAAGSSVLPALAVQCLSGALMLGLAALLLRRRRDGP